MRIASVSAALLLFVFVSGCKDPTTGKVRAAVGTPVAEAAEKPTENETIVRTYEFSGDGSRIDWVGSKVTGQHEGGFKDFSGTVEVPDGDLSRARIEVEIDLKSLWSDTDQLTLHLNSADFFETSVNPKSKFVSTSIEKGGEGDATHTVTGNLDLHGVKKSITFPAKIELSDDGLVSNAQFALDRQLFAVKYAGMPDDLIKDDVLVKLSISAASR
jgi:polyisoprenoid-binding protein YceI